MAGKKIPRKLKLLKGTLKPSRENKKEPKAEINLLKAPDYLNPLAEKKFNDLAQLLNNMQISSASDKDALAMLTDMYSIYREMRETLKKVGFVYETTNQHGDTMYRSRPEVSILTDAWKNVRSMMSEFGLTPSSRSRVSAHGENEEDPLNKFITKNG